MVSSTKVEGAGKVKPAGSVWLRNPIPACSSGFDGGAGGTQCEGAQFEPPLPGLFGYGLLGCVGAGKNPPSSLCRYINRSSPRPPTTLPAPYAR